MPIKPKTHTQQLYDRGLLKKPIETRPSAFKRGYNTYWKQLRLSKLHRDPLCAHCQAKGRVTMATEVDHILPLKEGGTNNWNNLQALCKSCHSKKTMTEFHEKQKEQ